MKSTSFIPFSLGIQAANHTAWPTSNEELVHEEIDGQTANFTVESFENEKWEEFQKKYSWNIKMGKQNCPTTSNFNDETDEILTYKGIYYPDEGVGSNTVDFAKVIIDCKLELMYR